MTTSSFNPNAEIVLITYKLVWSCRQGSLCIEVNRGPEDHVHDRQGEKINTEKSSAIHSGQRTRKGKGWIMNKYRKKIPTGYRVCTCCNISFSMINLVSNQYYSLVQLPTNVSHMWRAMGKWENCSTSRKLIFLSNWGQISYNYALKALKCWILIFGNPTSDFLILDTNNGRWPRG